MLKQRAVVIFIFLATFVACTQYSNNPELKLARDFIDAYYVFANQHQALPLTVGQASEELKKEIELTKDVTERQDSYRSRTVLFDLVKEMKTDDEALYLFKLTLKIPDVGDVEQMVNIAVDRRAHKIKYFGSLR